MLGGTLGWGGFGWIRWVGGGGYAGGADMRSWSKKLFLGTFWKFTTWIFMYKK